MTTVDISFRFFHADHWHMDNDQIHEIRKELATTLNNCGFGDVTENDSMFANTYAVPEVDKYWDEECELYISYMMWYPTPQQHGDFNQFITEGIHQLKQHIFTRFHIYTVIKIVFS